MKKKSINELALNKEIVAKFDQKVVNGGRALLVADPTYTHKDSPMTSCNGKCNGDANATINC